MILNSRPLHVVGHLHHLEPSELLACVAAQLIHHAHEVRAAAIRWQLEAAAADDTVQVLGALVCVLSVQLLCVIRQTEPSVSALMTIFIGCPRPLEPSKYEVVPTKEYAGHLPSYSPPVKMVAFDLPCPRTQPHLAT